MREKKKKTRRWLAKCAERFLDEAYAGQDRVRQMIQESIIHGLSSR